MKMSKPRVLDLFSGAGGMSHGFLQAGFDVSIAIDNWQDALDTHQLNHPETAVINVDLGAKSELDPALAECGNIDVIIGGPPCQGFSIAGKRDPSDPRNKLYKGFVRSVAKLKPGFFVMENVPTIGSKSNLALFNSILLDFKRLGYEVSAEVLLASKFGVPQNRKRMFIVGSLANKPKFDFQNLIELKMISTKEAISDLPEGTVPDGTKYTQNARSTYQEIMRSNSHQVFNHQVTKHSEQTVDVISLVPDGGNYKDLPENFLGIRNVNIAWTRLNSATPSFTIDTGHRHHFHYKYNRVPTARESARLQSFPDDYHFLGSKTSQLKQIGNAVPPILAKAVANEIYRTIGD
jgi:DNA (cytosine-5)-methyltransferase 1